MFERSDERGQAAVDARIVSLFAFAPLESAIQGRGVLRQAGGRAGCVVNRDVLGVERIGHPFHEVNVAAPRRNALEQVAKLVDPLPIAAFEQSIGVAHVAVGAAIADALEHDAQFRAAHHFFGGDVDLFPRTHLAEQLDMHRAIAVFLRVVDVVHQAARLFAKRSRENAVDAQADGFVGRRFEQRGEAGAVVDDPHHVAMLHVSHVAPRAAHAPVDAVGQSIAHFGAHLDAFFRKEATDARGEPIEPVGLLGAVDFEGVAQAFVAFRTAKSEG